MSWAINQLEIDDIKMEFSKKAFNEDALKEIARDIIQPSNRRPAFVKGGELHSRVPS
jgi:hypothetical protein